jgi:hypothetical protein
VSCFLGATGLVLSQETFAPLITDNCVGFVHVDLRKVELDKIRAAADKWWEQGLKELSFDEKSAKAVTREFNRTMKKIDKFVRPKFKLFADELGIRELAVIMDGWDSEKEQPVIFLALPWKNKTKADLKMFTDLLPLELHFADFWIEGDFLIFMANGNEDNKKYIKNLAPSKNSKIYEVLKEAGDGEIKIAFVINDQVRNGIKESVNGGLLFVSLPILSYLDSEQYFKNMILFTANKVEWVAASVSLGQYVGDSRKFSSRAVIKTHHKNDAVFLRNMIDCCIDYGVLYTTTFLAIMAQDKRSGITEGIDSLMSLAAEFFGGFMRKFLPEVKEDRLVLSFETDKFMSNYESSCFSIGLGILASAIRSMFAVRVSTVYDQDVNDVRQIMIAFHCYIDEHEKFPPLYTVDKNGKPLHSWRVLILPYLDQEERDLYKSIRLDEPWDSEYNKQFHKVKIYAYSSNAMPDSPPDKNCHIAVVEGQPLKPKDESPISDMKDGFANTVGVVLVRKPFCWMDPLANVTLDDLGKGMNKEDSIIGYGDEHRTPFGFWDCATRHFPSDIDPAILKKLGTVNGGEDVQDYLK